MGNVIFKVADIIYRFVALNLIWLLFFVLGLGIFGFMPATVALFAVIRQWIKGEKGFKLFKTYWHYYKADFIRSNLIWLIFVAVFYIVYVNYQFVGFYYDESIQFYIYLIVFAVATFVLMAFVNVFSVMAHYKFEILEYIKVASGMVIFRPFITLLQLFWLFVYYLIAVEWPKVFLTLGVSVLAFVLMSTNYFTFKKYDNRNSRESEIT